jgi:hypothetical protein
LKELKNSAVDYDSFIYQWVLNRIKESVTLYKISSPREKGRQLNTSRRVRYLLSHLKTDIKKFWTVPQRRLIAEGIHNQTYCRDTFDDLIRRDFSEVTKKVIYFYVDKNNPKKNAYVGKTDMALRKRHSGHLRGKSNFDKALKESTSNWSHGIICQYKNDLEMTRLEVLHVIVLNTSRLRKDTQGLNDMLGGELNATKKIKELEAVAPQRKFRVLDDFENEDEDVRVAKGTVVTMIQAITPNSWCVRTLDGKEFPIGRRKLEEIQSEI